MKFLNISLPLLPLFLSGRNRKAKRIKNGKLIMIRGYRSQLTFRPRLTYRPLRSAYSDRWKASFSNRHRLCGYQRENKIIHYVSIRFPIRMVNRLAMYYMACNHYVVMKHTAVLVVRVVVQRLQRLVPNNTIHVLVLLVYIYNARCVHLRRRRFFDWTSFLLLCVQAVGMHKVVLWFSREEGKR